MMNSTNFLKQIQFIASQGRIPKSIHNKELLNLRFLNKQQPENYYWKYFKRSLENEFFNANMKITVEIFYSYDYELISLYTKVLFTYPLLIQLSHLYNISFQSRSVESLLHLKVAILVICCLLMTQYFNIMVACQDYYKIY